MKKEFDDLLSGRYPLIFARRSLPAQQSAMYWGLMCGDGWFDLVDVLCEQLQNETDNNGAPQVVATQVKEKYGGLRFYVDSGNETQWGMIRMAEAMAERICEECGKPGRLLVDGRWFKTRCSEHTPTGAITAEEYDARLDAAGPGSGRVVSVRPVPREK